METSPAERADPLAAARADDGPRGRALLYLAIQAESSPGQRAELLRTALDAAVKSGTFPLAARLYQPELTKLVAAPELVRMAMPVGQALYLLGEDARAKDWYQRAHESAGPDGGVGAARLWALGRLADGDEFAPLDTGALMGWYEMQRRREPAAAAGRLTLLYALIEGLGDAVPGPAWEPLVTGKPKLAASAGDPLLAAELRSAAESGRVGETVLLVLDSIGARLPGPETTLAAYDCLVALRFAGLDREARELAIEIAVAAGL
jgi:tetratricopeptide (TPR) repeat protein